MARFLILAQAYSLDSFELSLSISYDYKVENVANFDHTRAQSHLLQALRNSISEETVEDVISGISDLERQMNKQLKRGGNLFGIKISNIVIDRVDIIGQLQFPKQEEVKEMSWEEEERLCEEAKKAADLLDQNPMALQLRILRSVEQNG
uniref:YicC_N domain-containing protein n=1 Tax=Bursaphelenchus xylophilus TaxID=6326 RepID=A0A1I7SRK9_BURXY